MPIGSRETNAGNQNYQKTASGTRANPCPGQARVGVRIAGSETPLRTNDLVGMVRKSMKRLTAMRHTILSDKQATAFLELARQ
jgi:hypothetical protein